MKIETENNPEFLQLVIKQKMDFDNIWYIKTPKGKVLRSFLAYRHGTKFLSVKPINPIDCKYKRLNLFCGDVKVLSYEIKRSLAKYSYFNDPYTSYKLDLSTPFFEVI